MFVTTYFLDLIARGLALVDGIMAGWFSTTAIDGTFGPYDNCDSTIINVQLSDCGRQFAETIYSIANGGVGLVDNLLVALGAGASAIY